MKFSYQPIIGKSRTRSKPELRKKKKIPALKAGICIRTYQRLQPIIYFTSSFTRSTI